MTRAAAILFDLDGTLVDTAPDMAGALNRLRVEEGLEPLAFDALRSSVSHGAARLVKLGFPSASAADFERLRHRFLQLYSGQLADGTRLFEGMEVVLARLADQGVPWGIVTNKPGWLTEPLLAQLDLAHRAACVVSGDTVAERKPHPLPLLHAARSLEVEAAGCVYVGDAERDMIAGRAAGMTTLAAAYGYLAADEDPAEWRPDGIIERPEHVLEWINVRGTTRSANA
jgi:phosphoglycolate phosphatase